MNYDEELVKNGKTTTRRRKKEGTAVVAYFAWVAFTLLLLMVDENPLQEVPLKNFFIVKAIALTSLVACYRTGRWMARRGYFKDITNEEE